MTLHDHDDAASLSVAEKREIVAAMRGLDWHIESYGMEQNARDQRWRHVTTAWTVHIMNHLEHVYEVGQWSHGQVTRTEQVRLLPDGVFVCTCPASKAGRSQRGYCRHVDHLTLHAVRRLPTLPAPARALRHRVAV
jgi:hypothetical protein